MLGADLVQDLRLFLAAHDVDEADAVLDADLVEHLAEVRGGGGVHQRLVTFAPHGLDHAERGQRIDEPRRAVGGRGARGQHHDVPRLHGAILRVHRAADHRDRLAHQRLGGVRRSGPDHDAGALVADRQRLIEPRRHHPHGGFRHLRGDHGSVLGARNLCGRHVGRADQQPEVGRIDRRGLDPDHDFVVGRLGRRDIHQRQFEFAALLEQRTQLQPGFAVTHRNSPVLCLLYLDALVRHASAFNAALPAYFACAPSCCSMRRS